MLDAVPSSRSPTQGSSGWSPSDPDAFHRAVGRLCRRTDRRRVDGAPGHRRAADPCRQLWAAERGFEYLTLETGAANNGARAFYASLGYCEEDVRITKRIESQSGLRTH